MPPLGRSGGLVGTAASPHGVGLAYRLRVQARTASQGEPTPGAPVDVTPLTDERVDVVASRRATALIFGITMLNALGNVAFHSLVARHAGTAGYGSVATLLSFGTVSLVVASGIQYAVARRTAQPGATAHGELARGGRALGPWLLLSVVLALGAGPASSYLHLRQSDAVVYAVAYFAANIVQAVPLGVLIGQRRFRAWALVVVFAVGVRLILLAALGSNGANDTGAIVASALATVLSAAFGAAWIMLWARSRSSVSDGAPGAVDGSGEVGALAREGIGGAVLGACLWLVWILPLVFARHYLSPGAAGKFGAAQFLASGVLFLVGAVTTAFFPSVAQHRSGRSVNAGAVLAVALSLVCVAGLVLVGPFVLRHLYGPNFDVSSELMAVLGVSVTAVALATFALWISRALRPTLLAPSIVVASALVGECLVGIWWHTGPMALAAGPAAAMSAAAVVAAALWAIAPVRSRMGLLGPRPTGVDDAV